MRAEAARASAQVGNTYIGGHLILCSCTPCQTPLCLVSPVLLVFFCVTKELRLMKATYKKCRCVRRPILINLSLNVILCFKRRRYLHLPEGESV